MTNDLHRDDSDVVEVIDAQATGPALILCEHASNFIPARFQGLGLSAEAQQSHAAWDPGARAVALTLATALIHMPSFTPVWFGTPRACEIGILHDKDTRLADAMLAEAHRLPHRVIRRNDPYGPEDGVTHSLKLHGLAHDLPNVMIEIRNDLLHDAAAEARMADEMLTLLRPALSVLAETTKGGAHA